MNTKDRTSTDEDELDVLTNDPSHALTTSQETHSASLAKYFKLKIKKKHPTDLEKQPVPYYSSLIRPL